MASFPTYYALLVLVLLLGAPSLGALAGGGYQFNILDKLLQETNLQSVIDKHLATSPRGLTAFSPTDAAFRKPPPGLLNRLTFAQKTQIGLFHLVPKYYSLMDLTKTTLPLQTFSPGKTLKLAFRQNKLFVLSGSMTTPVAYAIQNKYPVANFAINDVLVPPGMRF
ncbi:fasciclin-like arabinogalactan protein 6 [Wolffia australiana]